MSAVADFDIHVALWEARAKLHAMTVAFKASNPDGFSLFQRVRRESFSAFPECRTEATRNRKLAQIAGETKYMGLPCKHGHLGLRYTSNSGCIECTDDRKKESRHDRQDAE